MRRTSHVQPGAARAAALAAALAICGALLAVPAQAAPQETAAATKTPDAQGTPAALETKGPGSTSGSLPPGLAEALQRDLGITEKEFQAAGALGQHAAAALPRLQATEGFIGMALEDGELVITGTGSALQALADELGARLQAPEQEAAAPGTEQEAAPSAPPADPAPAPEPAPAATPAATAGNSSPATPEHKTPEESAASGSSVDTPGEPQQDTPDPAAATRTATDLASLARDYIASVGVEGLQSVGLGANGFTISVRDPEGPRPAPMGALRAAAAETTPNDFAAAYTNVRIEASGGAGSALEDVYGGQGLWGIQGPAPGGGQAFASCSIGFNGWDPTGNPAVITAGHCTADGTVTDTVLAPLTAGGAPTTPLGTYGTSMFGGPGNTPGVVGTDVAVVDGINDDLDLLPEVTQWANGNLSETTTAVTGVGTAVPGAPVCRSGLTTGWHCGTVLETSIFAVAGHNSGTDPEDVRAVFGFTASVLGAPGDSGGPMISGTTAVGLVSAGFDDNQDGTIDSVGAADLSTALSVTGGYTVAHFVQAPELAVEDGQTVFTDQVLTGTAPAGSTVRITVNSDTAEIPATAEGTWAMKVPRTVADGETARITATAVMGFNTSKTTTYNLTVKHSPLDAPVLTNPANGSSTVGELRTVEGTGEPGATVELQIAPVSADGNAPARAAAEAQTVTAAVGAGGSFAAQLDEALAPGAYTVVAVQDGVEGKAASPAATSTFGVIYPAPAITSLRDGEVFTEATAPRTVSGTGVPGATLTVTVGVTDPVAVVDADGNWSVELGTWPAGEFRVSAIQELDGIGSAEASVTVRVTAVQVAAVSNPGGKLPATGSSGSSAALLSAAGILLLGGAAGVGYSRRRTAGATVESS